MRRDTPAETRATPAARSMAVFQVGDGRYALPVEAVCEAVSGRGLVQTPERKGAALGLLAVQAEGTDRKSVE